MSRRRSTCCCGGSNPIPPGQCQYCSGATPQVQGVIVTVSYTPCPAVGCEFHITGCGDYTRTRTPAGSLNGTHVIPVTYFPSSSGCGYCKVVTPWADATITGCTPLAGVVCGNSGSFQCDLPTTPASVVKGLSGISVSLSGTITVAGSDYSTIIEPGVFCTGNPTLCNGICTRYRIASLFSFNLTTQERTDFCDGATIQRIVIPPVCASPPGSGLCVNGDPTTSNSMAQSNITVTVTRM